MAKKNYFKEVAAYQKAHPRVSREGAMKAVSASRKSGTVGAVKRKNRVTAKKISGVAGTVNAKTRKLSGGATVGNLAKGNAIIGRIDTLEQQRKKVVGKLKKDLLALEINNEHARLDKLMRNYKKA